MEHFPLLKHPSTPSLHDDEDKENDDGKSITSTKTNSKTRCSSRKTRIHVLNTSAEIDDLNEFPLMMETSCSFSQNSEDDDPEDSFCNNSCLADKTIVELESGEVEVAVSLNGFGGGLSLREGYDNNGGGCGEVRDELLDYYYQSQSSTKESKEEDLEAEIEDDVGDIPWQIEDANNAKFSTPVRGFRSLIETHKIQSSPSSITSATMTLRSQTLAHHHNAALNGASFHNDRRKEEDMTLWRDIHSTNVELSDKQLREISKEVIDEEHAIACRPSVLFDNESVAHLHDFIHNVGEFLKEEVAEPLSRFLTTDHFVSSDEEDEDNNNYFEQEDELLAALPNDFDKGSNKFIQNSEESSCDSSVSSSNKVHSDSGIRLLYIDNGEIVSVRTKIDPGVYNAHTHELECLPRLTWRVESSFNVKESPRSVANKLNDLVYEIDLLEINMIDSLSHTDKINLILEKVLPLNSVSYDPELGVKLQILNGETLTFFCPSSSSREYFVQYIGKAIGSLTRVLVNGDYIGFLEFISVINGEMSSEKEKDQKLQFLLNDLSMLYLNNSVHSAFKS